MKRLLERMVVCLCMVLVTKNGFGFCGFYVAKADAQLFNKASQVVLVRDDDKTVLTMVNDFKGDPKEFAIVIPVPTFLERDQIHVGDKAIVDHLDAYTAPRLVEYFDENPCQPIRRFKNAVMAPMAAESAADRQAKSLGVTIEAKYTVGEYDILILSAEQSGGLQTWLSENGYRVPKNADKILGSYIKQNMRFFVAKVNLEEQSKLGFSYLRPIQVAFESPKFMLPIRLGTVNAEDTQELFIYTLTRNGRVETTNYRTVKLPTGMDLPVFTKNEFADFYRAMFSKQVEKEDMRVVFLEYAWDMNWCDPCAADPLSQQELRQLGVFWLDDRQGNDINRRNPVPRNVFVTRLHVRYDADHFPEDLFFQQTGDRQNYQGRYVLRHPWTGNEDCEQARHYRNQLRERQEKEAQQLASLTGWEINEIRRKMDLKGTPVPTQPWWRKLWNE